MTVYNHVTTSTVTGRLDIPEWVSDEAVTSTTERVAPRNSDGEFRIWRSNTDRTTGAFFDETEEAEWTDFAPPPVLTGAGRFRYQFPSFTLASQGVNNLLNEEPMDALSQLNGSTAWMSVDFGTSGAGQLTYDFNTTEWSEAIYIRKTTTHVQVFTFRTTGGLNHILLFNPNDGSLQWMGSSNATSVPEIGGTPMVNTGQGSFVDGHANSVVGDDLGPEWRFMLRLPVDASGTWSELLTGCTDGAGTFPVITTANRAHLEFGFTTTALLPTGPVPTRWNTTLNGVLYGGDTFVGHRGSMDGSFTRYWLDLPANQELDIANLDTTGSVGSPIIQQVPGTINAVDVKSDGGAVIATIGFKALPSEHLIQQVSLVPQDGVAITDLIPLGTIMGGSTKVLTISNVPTGQSLTNVEFFKQGTLDVTTGTFTKLEFDTVVISGITEPTDIRFSSVSILAPELRLHQDTKTWIPTAPGAVGATTVNPGNINGNDPADLTVLTSFMQSQTFSATPTATVNIDVDLTGLASTLTSWPKFSVVAFDAVGDAPLTSVFGSLGGDDTAHTVWLHGNNNLYADGTSRRGSVGQVHLKFLAPASGQYYLRCYPTSNALNVAEEELFRIHTEVTESLTVAATDRIQLPRTLTITGTGVTVNSNSPGYDSATTALINTDLATTILLDLPAGEGIVTAVGTDCTVTMGESLLPGMGLLNVVPTGVAPSVVITTGAIHTSVDVMGYYYGRVQNTSAGTGGTEGYPWVEVSKAGTEITQTGDLRGLVVAEGFTYEINAFKNRTRGNARVSSLAITDDSTVDLTTTQSVWDTSLGHSLFDDDTGNVGGSGTVTAILQVPTGSGARTIRGMDPWQNHLTDVTIIIKVIAKEGVSTIPELFSGFPITANGNAPISGGTGYTGQMLPVRVAVTVGSQIDQASVAATNGAQIGAVIAGSGNGEGVIMVEVVGSATDVTFTEKLAGVGTTSLNLLGEYDASDLDINPNTVVNTGLNFDAAEYVEFSFTDNDATRSPWPVARIDTKAMTAAATNEEVFIWNHDNGYLNIFNINMATGTFTITESVRNVRLQAVRTWGASPVGYSIPEATVVATMRTITVVGATNTLNGAAAVLAADTYNTGIQIDLAANMQLDTVEPAANIRIDNAITGHISVTPSGADISLVVTQKQAATYDGQMLIGEWTAPVNPGYARMDPGTNGGILVTGIDMTRCTRLKFAVSNSTGLTRHVISEVPINLGTSSAQLQIQHYSGSTLYYTNIRINDAATGEIQWDDQVAAGYCTHIWGFADGPVGYVVPTGTTAATPRTITSTGGLATVEGSASKSLLEGLSETIQLDLNTGMQIDEATLAITSGTVGVVNSISGLIRVTPGPADGIVSFSEKASATYQGDLVVGEWVPATPFATTGTLVNVDTGIDFTLCDEIRMCFRTTSDTHAMIQSVPVPDDAIIPAQSAEMMWHWHDTSYIQGNFSNVGDKATGSLRVRHLTTAFEILWIRGYATGTLNTVVPTGTVVATSRSISSTGGLSTIEGSGSKSLLEGLSETIQLDLSPNQQLDESTLAISSGTVGVVNATSGLVRVTPGAADGVISFTEKQASFYNGQIFVGEWNAPATPGYVNMNGTLVTGIDMNLATRLKFYITRNTDLTRHKIVEVPVNLGPNAHQMQLETWSGTTATYTNLGIVDAATGEIQWNDITSSQYCTKIEGFVDGILNTVVPTGTVATTKVNVTATSNTVAKTIDGSLTKVMSELVGKEVQLELAQGEVLTNVDITPNTAHASVVDGIRGIAWIEIPSLVGDCVIDYQVSNFNGYEVLLASGDLNSGSTLVLNNGLTIGEIATQYSYLRVEVLEQNQNWAQPHIISTESLKASGHYRFRTAAYDTEYQDLIPLNNTSQATREASNGWVSSSNSFNTSTTRVFGLSLALAVPLGYRSPRLSTVTVQNNTNPGLSIANGGTATVETLEGLVSFLTLSMDSGHEISSVSNAILKDPVLGQVYLLGPADDSLIIEYETVAKVAFDWHRGDNQEFLTGELYDGREVYARSFDRLVTANAGNDVTFIGSGIIHDFIELKGEVQNGWGGQHPVGALGHASNSDTFNATWRTSGNQLRWRCVSAVSNFRFKFVCTYTKV